jgi:2-C-methyl-D-erythritol 4-phosphate cytidylyltransferase
LTAADGPSPADAVVVAAGSSQRMGGLDKLAWTVGDRPLLAHTLEALAAAPSVGSIVVVTAPVRREELAAAPWLPAAVGAVVAGGERRQDSVLAGMAALETLVPDPDGRRVVLVHDGARPLVTPDLIESVVAGSARYGAAIPVLPIAETVKRVADDRILETTGVAGHRPDAPGHPTRCPSSGAGLADGHRWDVDRRGRPPGGL